MNASSVYLVDLTFEDKPHLRCPEEACPQRRVVDPVGKRSQGLCRPQEGTLGPLLVSGLLVQLAH
jgi:hypothetical protein